MMLLVVISTKFSMVVNSAGLSRKQEEFTRIHSILFVVLHYLLCSVYAYEIFHNLKQKI